MLDIKIYSWYNIIVEVEEIVRRLTSLKEQVNFNKIK